MYDTEIKPNEVSQLKNLRDMVARRSGKKNKLKVATSRKKSKRHKKMRSKTKKLQPRKKILIGGSAEEEYKTAFKKYAKILESETGLTLILNNFKKYINDSQNKGLIQNLELKLSEINSPLTKEAQIDKILKPALDLTLKQVSSDIKIQTALTAFNMKQKTTSFISGIPKDTIQLTTESIFNFSKGMLKTKILDIIAPDDTDNLIDIILHDLRALAKIDQPVVAEPTDLPVAQSTYLPVAQSTDLPVAQPTDLREDDKVTQVTARLHTGDAGRRTMPAVNVQAVQGGLRRRRFKSRNKMYSSRKNSKRKSRRRYNY